jgi:hypothetical protein
MAAPAGVVKRPDSVAAAADPVSARKLRRDNADMLALPQNDFYGPMMRPTRAFRKPPMNGAGALRAHFEMLSLGCRSCVGSGARNLNRHLSRLALAIAFSLTLTPGASAETVAQTARNWGLIGPWSVDCSLKLDRNRGTLLAYEIAPGDRVVHRRNFSDTRDESEVVTAEVSADGLLNLRVFFPSLKQTREFGLMMQRDGTIRAIYNRNHKGEYTIRNGKFTANGNPTPPQHKCVTYG